MMTYEEVANATADDLIAVIDQIKAIEKKVRDGDIAAVPSMLEKWGTWGQILLIRLETRTEEYRSSQQDDLALTSPDDQRSGT